MHYLFLERFVKDDQVLMFCCLGLGGDIIIVKETSASVSLPFSLRASPELHSHRRNCCGPQLEAKYGA
jgi:hypothetical protein